MGLLHNWVVGLEGENWAQLSTIGLVNQRIDDWLESLESDS